MSMRVIGNVLLWFGAAVGVASGVWLWLGPSAGGLSWFVGIGLIKLTFVAGLALIATGAVALRIENRRLHKLLDGADDAVVITADRKALRRDRQKHLR